MLLAQRTLVNWPHYLFSEVAYEERWVMWETCHQMSWVWLKGSEAGPLHPTRKECYYKTAVGTTLSKQRQLFSARMNF